MPSIQYQYFLSHKNGYGVNRGHFNIFVVDLSPEVTDATLFACFSVYSSCSDARVMWDQKTRRSRGFGFVSFRNEQEAQTAINDLTEKWLGSRQIRCNWATKGAGVTGDKHNSDAKSMAEFSNRTSDDGHELKKEDAPENKLNYPQYTTVYVGNLAPEVTQLDILEKIFPVIASRVFDVLLIHEIPSGPGSNTEENRELQELQKTLYTFFHVITTHDLSSVFLTSEGKNYLKSIMPLLLHNCCYHKDTTVRKSCVQIFIRLIKDWCTGSQDEEKVPGFRNFIVESFAPSCCLYSVLDKSFEFRDANTLVLFGEIVVAQKIMYEKLGDEFLVHFVMKGFQTAHCPQNLAEEYCQKLQGSDIKALKSFYQSLIEDLRRQQNGTFVFR